MSELSFHFAMSLDLIQGYSSAEEEDEQEKEQPQNDDVLHRDSSDDDDDDDSSASVNRSIVDRSLFDRPHPNASGLPSAFEAFSEVLPLFRALIIAFLIDCLEGKLELLFWSIRVY